MERKIKLIEQVNGLNLNHGDRVYDAANGELLRLTSSPGTIRTDDSRGNYRCPPVKLCPDCYPEGRL